MTFQRIWSEEMTDEEKEQHPEYKITNGYLRELDKSECGQLWWNGLSDHEKDIIKSLPNFDAEIFKFCIFVVQFSLQIVKKNTLTKECPSL